MTDDQLNLFDDGNPRARRTDPTTSHAAARELTTLNTHCAALLTVYSKLPQEHAKEAGRRGGLAKAKHAPTASSATS